MRFIPESDKVIKMVLFCFDSSALIKLKDEYPEDIFHNLWANIKLQLESGLFVLSYLVFIELRNGFDNYSDFFHEYPSSIIEITDKIQQIAAEIINTHTSWIAPNSTKNSADPFVIATAQNLNAIVVTEESFNLNRLKIPKICDELNIPCINLLEYFRRSNYSF